MNISHKAGQVVGACLFCFLSQDAAWHPSGGKCAERKLSTGSESAPVLPTSGLNVLLRRSACQSHSWSLKPLVNEWRNLKTRRESTLVCGAHECAFILEVKWDRLLPSKNRGNQAGRPLTQSSDAHLLSPCCMLGSEMEGWRRPAPSPRCKNTTHGHFLTSCLSLHSFIHQIILSPNYVQALRRW